MSQKVSMLLGQFTRGELVLQTCSRATHVVVQFSNLSCGSVQLLATTQTMSLFHHYPVSASALLLLTM